MMKSKHLLSGFLILSIIVIIFLSGCTEKETKFVCPDGTVVSDTSLCPEEEQEIIVFCLDQKNGVCYGRYLNEKCANTDNYGCCPSEIQYPNQVLCNKAKEDLLNQVDTQAIGKCIVEHDISPPTMIDEECKLDADCYEFASAIGIKNMDNVKCLK